MMHKLYVGILFLFFELALNAQNSNGNKPPNIIFILADDQPYDYLSCNGNEIASTPNIDRLASEGARFTNAHVTSAISTPSRISIFLSQYERKHGVNFNSGTSVAPEAWENSYPSIMRENGYYTGYIGKNHAPVGEGGYSSGMIEESFDYWYAGHGHLGFYPKEVHEIFSAAENETQIEVLEEGVDDFLSSNTYSLEGANHFLKNRPEDKPFCLSLCFNLPHGASTSTMELRESDPEIYKTLYRDINIPLPDNYIAKSDIINPKLPLTINHVADRQDIYDYVDNPETLLERYIRHLQATVGIDRLVGKLREQLKELGLDENTIIIYSSDHGIMLGQFGLGGKALCYEQCTKVPLIIFDPQAPPEAKGIVSDELVQSIDIAPTMLSYAGINSPEEFQGVDLSPLVKGNDQAIRSFLFTENLWSNHFGNPRCEAVQTKEWKYIRYFENQNLSARFLKTTAIDMGMNYGNMLYSVHDPDMALYRSFIEAPMEGEQAVYEELYYISRDPKETNNLAHDKKYQPILEELRNTCNSEVQNARGEGLPQVVRYTHDSQLENQQTVVHH